MTTAGPTYSPDRQWVWDGAHWQPVLSADGKWRSNGFEWVPVDRRSSWNGFQWVQVPRPRGTHDSGPEQSGPTGLSARRTSVLAVVSMISGIAALVLTLAGCVGFGSWVEGQLYQQPAGVGAVALILAGGVGLLFGVVASVTASIGLKRINRSGGLAGRSFAYSGLGTGAFALGLVGFLPVLFLGIAAG